MSNDLSSDALNPFEALRAFKLHLEAEGKSANTVRAYMWGVEKALSTAEKPLAEWTKADVDGLRVGLQGELSSASRRTFDISLRMFLKHVGRPDLAQYKLAKVTWTPKQPPTREEMETVISSCENKLERALILTLYSTGVRIGELLGNEVKGNRPVQIEDVDWEEKRFKAVWKGMNEEEAAQKPTWVYFMYKDRTAIAALRDWTGARRTGPLFGIDPRQARDVLADVGKRVGIHLHPHILRHCCATHFLEANKDIAVVQRHLRHKDLATTQKYLHFGEAQLERAREELPEELR